LPQPIPLVDRLSSPPPAAPHVDIPTDPDPNLWEVVDQAQSIRWNEHAPVAPGNDGMLRAFHLGITVLHHRRRNPYRGRIDPTIDDRIEAFVNHINRRLYDLEYYGISVWYDYHGNGGV
jgi:hypothetical protein